MKGIFVGGVRVVFRGGGNGDLGRGHDFMCSLLLALDSR